MITGIGPAGSGRVDIARGDGVKRGEPAAPVEATKSDAPAAPASPVAQLVAQGAPVDLDKVAAIRAAIAEGRYQIDPGAIADKMIALDLPGKSA